jgi:hypothetical protein
MANSSNCWTDFNQVSGQQNLFCKAITADWGFGLNRPQPSEVSIVRLKLTGDCRPAMGPGPGSGRVHFEKEQFHAIQIFKGIDHVLAQPGLAVGRDGICRGTRGL